MIKRILVILAILLSVSIVGYADINLTHSISLVPRPAQFVPGSGNYLFSAKTVFAVENKEQAEVATDFINLFTRAAGFTPKLNVSNSKGDVRFVSDKTVSSEAYILEVSPKGILVKASDSKGFFYALQTIRQLLPAAIEGTEFSPKTVWKIPALKITDEPRFGYRGFMLDVSRFFMPKEKVLRIIDCMAMLKVNKLHFHLVDDNGWRLEIKKHPRLTEVGAWRADRPGLVFPERRNQEEGEPTPIGGFYTQDDIREIVAYASRRQIEVIPEIEMPAHSNAALASYPMFACPIVEHFIGVLPGIGGQHAATIFCAGNDSAFNFLQDVIDEVCALFPSRYIHLGGDEAWKTNWKKCPLCQERMKKEQLEHVEDLQGYFMNRMGDYVRSKGKDVMGWDELTNSKLPKDAVIFGWQGYGQAAIKAAELGHRFVMTPARIMYLIRYQGPQWFEPVTYFGNVTLKDVYDYEPVQADWKPEYASLLMGVQASMWTEFCNTPEEVEYQVFPRLAALAEVAWVKPEQKDWTSFLQGLDGYLAHINQKGVTSARSMYNIQQTITSQNRELKVELECIRPDVEVRYTTDGSEPKVTSSLYKSLLTVTSSVTIKSATFANGKQMGKTLILPLQWNKATAKSIFKGKQKEELLTNGLRGSLKYTDFEWCQWDRNDSISFTIDLEKREKLNSFVVGCVTNYGMAAHKPKMLRVALSDDNKNFREVGKLCFTPKEIFREGNFIEDLTIPLEGNSARYVQVTAFGAGNCPDDHVRSGQEARVYFDEVIIK